MIFIDNRLKFGTAGIRAEMKRGAGFLNIATVRSIAAGTADFLLSEKSSNPADKADKAAKTDYKGEKTGGPAVVICYDGRKNSRLFAAASARVFASRGLAVYLPSRPAPTPYLSFAVRTLCAAAGVMITASHNTKEYNGYKLYGADGCQLTDCDAERVWGFISKTGKNGGKNHGKSDNAEDKKELEPLSFYRQSGRIKGFDLSRQYLNAVKARRGVALNLVKKSGLKIVYTPLCGVGGAFAKKLFKGNTGFFVAGQEFFPDKEFSACPQPNPEKKEAYAGAVKQAQKIDADLILANDPDADRLGVMVKADDGYKMLSGNEIGVLLLSYLLEKNKKSLGIGKKDKQGKNENGFIKKPLAVRTLVSTPLADKLIEDFGGEIVAVPTGFKYIGEVIADLEKKGEDSRFLLGFEESHGYLSGSYVRDKDGLLAAALVASYAAELKAEGHTLLDALERIYKKYGYFKHKTLSYKFSDLSKISGIMARLRAEKGIERLKTEEVKDYLSGGGAYKPDMIEICLPDARLIVRPSGTEPLVKVYITCRCVSAQKSDELTSELEKICNAYFV